MLSPRDLPGIAVGVGLCLIAGAMHLPENLATRVPHLAPRSKELPAGLISEVQKATQSNRVLIVVHSNCGSCSLKDEPFDYRTLASLVTDIPIVIVTSSSDTPSLPAALASKYIVIDTSKSTSVGTEALGGMVGALVSIPDRKVVDAAYTPKDLLTKAERW